MARDPPSLLDSSELRDLSLTPSSVRSAKITIVHPQLRDLILPLERGRVLYPRGKSIEEQRWAASKSRSEDTSGDEDEDMQMEGGEKGHKGGITGTTKPFVTLRFTPNCLTASRDIIACGGQHGELYISSLPRISNGAAPLLSSPGINPFSLSLQLPMRSINNSILILPDWPGDWKKRERSRRLGYLGRRSREWIQEEDEDEDEDDVTRESERSRGGYEAIDEDMDIDEDDDIISSSPSSPATYPNTVPFLHAPRIPHLSPSTPASTSISIQLPGRRTTSFSHDRPPRDTFRRPSTSSIFNPIAARRGSTSGQPSIQYVSSLPTTRPSGLYRSPSNASSSRSTWREDSRMSGPSSKASKLKPRGEPRMLVSNNDQTIKMFSLESAGISSDDNAQSQARGSALYAPSAPWRAQGPQDRNRQRSQISSSLQTDLDRYMVAPSMSLPPPRFGSSLGWDSIGINEGLGALNEQVSRDLERMEERLREANASEADIRREVEAFEHILGMGMRRSPAPPPSARIGQQQHPISTVRDTSPGDDTHMIDMSTHRKTREDRKLVRIGGAKFKYAINHSSISPDLKTLVSVGDSTDVYLFEVIEGGHEFRKIATYQAATDSGFSTSWSKDGRKFAVASQDGQVTVWDHRSSRPLAIFHTTTPPSSPSFTTDLASQHLTSHEPQLSYERWASPSSWTSSQPPADSTEREMAEDEGRLVLIDPVTGDPRNGSSSSGREAARVVKFSPEGSDRDLMVFSEENSNIHIIDARTFHTHVIVPVPCDVNEHTATRKYRHRSGSEGGTWGIGGVAFDPSGDWLYSGTESTVVEWDLRRFGGGGESSTWQMA